MITQWNRCSGDRLTSIKHLSCVFPCTLPPPTHSLHLHQALLRHQGCKQKLFTIFMRPPDDKWKREQKKEQKPTLYRAVIAYRSSSHLQLFSQFLRCSLSFQLSLPFYSLPHMSVNSLFITRHCRVCARTCVCEFAHYNTDRKAKHPVLFYAVWCFVNGEWWRQKHCVCVLTVTKRQLKHSHSALPPYFPPLLLQIFFFLLLLLCLFFSSTYSFSSSLSFILLYYCSTTSTVPSGLFLVTQTFAKISPEQPMSTHTSVTVTSTAHLSSFGFVHMLRSDIHHTKSLEGVQNNHHNLRMSACLAKLPYHVQLNKNHFL